MAENSATNFHVSLGNLGVYVPKLVHAWSMVGVRVSVRLVNPNPNLGTQIPCMY